VLLLDVNIVLAAHRVEHPHHGLVRPWFEGLLDGDESFGVPTLVWASLLRIATHRRIFDVPSPREAVFAFLDATVAQPRHLAVAPGPRHLTILRRLCDEADVTVITLDRDFARFTSVLHRRPGGG